MSGLHRNSSHLLLVPNPESGSWYEELYVKEMVDQVREVNRIQYRKVGTKGASPDSCPDCIAKAPCRPSFSVLVTMDILPYNMCPFARAGILRMYCVEC